MTKLAKKYIAMAKKKVPPGQWQKRGLKTAWALQKRGAGGKSRAKPKGKPKSKPRARPRGNPTASNNKSPKIGAAIQAFKGAQPLASMPIDAVVRNGPNEAALNAMRRKATVSYAGNVAMTGINQAVDKKIAQGGALSRGSVTAWAAEGFAALKAFDEVKGQKGKDQVLAVNKSLAQTINGYDPESGRMDLANTNFRTYQGIKVGGGVARRLSNVGPFKRITAPLKKFLGELGGAF